jgi:hypothetical protein
MRRDRILRAVVLAAVLVAGLEPESRAADLSQILSYDAGHDRTVWLAEQLGLPAA